MVFVHLLLAATSTIASPQMVRIRYIYCCCHQCCCCFCHCRWLSWAQTSYLFVCNWHRNVKWQNCLKPHITYNIYVYVCVCNRQPPFGVQRVVNKSVGDNLLVADKKGKHIIGKQKHYRQRIKSGKCQLLCVCNKLIQY